MDGDGDNKVTFREFAESITPVYPGLEPVPVEFNVEKKEAMLKKLEEHKKVTIRDNSHSPLRDYRNIY